MIRLRSFKLRLTLGYAFMLTVLLSGFAFLMYFELSRALYHDVEKNMLSESQRIEEMMTRYLQTPSGLKLDQPPPIEKGLLALPEGYQRTLTETIWDWERGQRRIARSLFLVRIVALDRSVMLSNLGGWEREIIFPDFERDSVLMETGSSYQTIHFQTKPVMLYYQLVRMNGRPLFVIQVAKPLYEIEDTLKRLALIIILIVPVGVALAGWAGWFLAKRFLSPVDRMIQQSRKITAAYLKSRLPRTYTQDELDRLAETLNEMIDRLEGSTRAVQEFSSNVSHEFKTPLAIIRGEIDLALRRDRSQEDLQKALRVIDEEVNSLVRLVDDLNLLVKSDARQLNIRKKRLSLTQLLEHAVGSYRERAQREGVALSFSGQGDTALEGDDIYLKRMFVNLLDNAIKFTDRGGEVSVECCSQDNKAVVRIRDTGIGIDPDTLEHIGTRFCRAAHARSREGAGLGLSIVKAICDAHLGKIHIDSSVGKGTCVSLEIPL